MLTSRQKFLAAITDRWGGLKLDAFQERLLLQKRIFFTSMLGVDLGHVHSWYIRGPYSRGLTEDAFKIESARASGDVEPTTLPDDLIEKVDEVQALFGDDWNDHQRMELLASVYFLAKKYDRKDLDFLSEKLTSFKKNFTEQDAADAVDSLSEKGIL